MNFQRDSVGDPNNPAFNQNITIACTNLEVYYCPSDPMNMKGSVHSPGGPAPFNTMRWASLNYRANIGEQPAPIGSWHRLHAGSGPYSGGMFEMIYFGWPAGTGVQKRDVTDGLAHTAVFSESIRGSDTAAPVDRSTFYLAPSPAWWDSRIGLRNCKQQNLVAPWGHRNHSGLFWTRGEPLYTMYTHGLTPNTRNCAWASSDSGDGSWTIGFNVNAMSYHPGGVNMAFGDGTVRFISDNIDQEVYRWIGSRDDAHPVQAW
jgi:prepilin-type processing-associated H-X9-DG protein